VKCPASGSGCTRAYDGPGSAQHSRFSFINTPPPAGLPLHSYNLVNLRVGMDQGPWETALFARNLFDKLGEIGDLQPEGAQLPGRPRYFVTRPRTIGIQVKREF
jgi:hypothetical protein